MNEIYCRTDYYNDWRKCQNVRRFGFSKPITNTPQLCAIGREEEWDLAGTHGKKFATGSMKKSWRMSYDFKPTKTSGSWDTMVRITDNGPVYQGNPRNVVGLFIIPNSLKIRMHFVFDITDLKKSPNFDTPALTLNEWNTIEVSQMENGGTTTLLVTLNGVTHHNVVNKNPHLLDPLDFYHGLSCGNSWKWTANGKMRNFQFISSDVAADIPPHFGTYE